MKKILMVLTVLFVCFGACGCSKKTYKSDDYEAMNVVAELEELKREGEEEGILIDYKFSKTLKDKYLVVITFVFGDHELEVSLVADTIAEIETSTFDSDGSDWTWKVDGKEYDYETAIVLVDHYYEDMN